MQRTEGFQRNVWDQEDTTNFRQDLVQLRDRIELGFRVGKTILMRLLLELGFSLATCFTDRIIFYGKNRYC